MKKSPNAIDANVGSRIRLRRVMLGISQEKLGEGLGITFQQVQKYEKGTNRVGASRLQHIADLLDVHVSFFFEGGPGPLDTQPLAVPSVVAQFMNSKEGIALVKAFSSIEDKTVRRRILDLVQALGAEQTAAPSLHSHDAAPAVTHHQ